MKIAEQAAAAYKNVLAARDQLVGGEKDVQKLADLDAAKVEAGKVKNTAKSFLDMVQVGAKKAVA